MMNIRTSEKWLFMFGYYIETKRQTILIINGWLTLKWKMRAYMCILLLQMSGMNGTKHILFHYCLSISRYSLYVGRDIASYICGLKLLRLRVFA